MTLDWYRPIDWTSRATAVQSSSAQTSSLMTSLILPSHLFSPPCCLSPSVPSPTPQGASKAEQARRITFSKNRDSLHREVKDRGLEAAAAAAARVAGAKRRRPASVSQKAAAAEGQGEEDASAPPPPSSKRKKKNEEVVYEVQAILDKRTRGGQVREGRGCCTFPLFFFFLSSRIYNFLTPLVQ
jgi:hypothetical protein